MSTSEYIALHMSSLSPSFNDIFFAYCQSPQHETIHNKETIKINGWILQRSDLSEIKILAKCNDSEYITNISIERKDVIARYGNANKLFLKQELCGFEIEIPYEQKIQTIQLIAIKKNAEHSWITINVSSKISTIRNSKAAWIKYCTSRAAEITREEIDDFNAISEIEKKSIIFASPTTIYNSEQLITHAQIPPDNTRSTINFFSHINDQDFISSTIEKATTKNKITIPSPLGAGNSHCTESFTSDQNITILKFTNEDGEVFFAYQSIAFIDSIFFPLRNIYLIFQDIQAESARNHLTKAFQDFEEKIQYAIHSNENEFIGIITGHNRPYHYFYNTLPAIQKLSEDNVLQKIGKLISLPGCNYIEIENLFPEAKNKEVILSHPQLRRLLQEKKFLCQLGFKFINSDHQAISTINKLDKLLRNTHKPKDSSTLDNQLNLKKFFPVIWFGIMNQKRCWIEQIPAAANILNEIKKSFPSLAVVFDGWTMPLSPTDLDKQEIKKDHKTIEEITKKLDQEILAINIAGQSAAKKIQIAANIDCYIGNGAAGILFVDRIADRLGIGHLNKKMINSPLYLHRNATILPPEQIIDIEDSGRADYISYSANPDFIKKTLINLIEKSVQQRFISTENHFMQ